MTLRKAALVGAAACLAALGSAAAASATVGPHTAITTPAGPTYRFHYVGGTSNPLAISGTASAGVSAVDIYCYAAMPGSTNPESLATNVPVTNGVFSATGQFGGNLYGPCRLRALPSGTTPTGYVASFSGPIVYGYGTQKLTDGNTLYGYMTGASTQTGAAVFTDAGQFGVYALLSVTPPAERLGPLSNVGNFSLHWEDIEPSGTSTRSAVRVDGHDAYLPYGVKQFLRGTQGLAVTQSALTVRQVFARNGDATLSESAPLMRCSGDDTYPPTSASCPSLEPTGVKFVRVSHFFRNGHQVRVRDAFVSTDGAHHVVAAQYSAAAQPPAAGGTGFLFPDHAARFQLSRPGEKLSGFAKGSASILERSDIFASSDDPAADTSAVTWSRPPASVQFDSASGGSYGMNYTVHVPAHGSGYLGFAVSERLATADVKPLAKLAERDMMAAPKITSPKNGGTVHGTKTTITGRLSLGANGLPTSVKVNGHAAKITAKNARSAIFSATFNEAFGKHRIKVVATDAGGNTRTASTRITNTH